MKNLFYQSFITFLVGFALLFNGCNNEEPIVFDEPVVTISGDASEILKVGADISVALTITTDDPINALVVNKNGGFLEEIGLSAEIPVEGVITYTYTGQTVAADAEEASEVVFNFSVVNSQDKESAAVVYTVVVTRYDVITIGSTDLSDLSSFEGDASLLLAEGRNYYLASDLSFNDGTELTIEAGVTLYMAGDSVDVHVGTGATINAVGTVDAPIVVTSLKPLLGEVAEAGDWDDFTIEGTGDGDNSGTLKYVRLEYSDGGLRLGTVGDGTTVSYVQVFKTNSSGIRASDGGNVNLDHCIVIDAPNRSFRLGDNAWGGFGQFLISWNLVDAGECFYIREESGNTILSNISAIGPGADSEVGVEEHIGIYMKSAANYNKVYNSIAVAQCDVGVKNSGDVDVTDIDGDRVLAYSHVFLNKDRDTEKSDTLWFTDAGFHNSEVAIAGVDSLGFVPTTAQTSEFDPSTIDAFFEAALFVGAVKDAASDWTTGWSINRDGSVR